MFTLEIDDKVVEFKFGIKFVMEMNKLYQMERSGQTFGYGIERAYTMINEMRDPEALVEVLYIANKVGKGPKLTKEKFIDALDDTDLEEVFEGVVAALMESSAIAPKIKALEKSMQPETTED